MKNKLFIEIEISIVFYKMTFHKKKNYYSKNNPKNIFLKYKAYKDKRKKISFKNIDSSFSFTQNAKIAIIIPYRNREKHLEEFTKYFQKENFDVYVIEQMDDQKFNRGLLLNAGFHIASQKKNYDYYIFHDVDSLPDETLLKNYYYNGNKIIHYASPYLGYKYNFGDFFGGIVGMDKETFIKINGYPNNFYGWGGEDDALYNHVALSGFEVYRPTSGSYILLDHPEPKKEEINDLKRENILRDLKNWKIYGYSDIKHLYLLQNHYTYYPTSNSKSSSKSASKSSSKKGLKVYVYQVKIALVHPKFETHYSLMRPLVEWKDVEEHIIDTFDDEKYTKFDGKMNKKNIYDNLIETKVSKEYEDGLRKEDLEKTLKFIFDNYREVLYIRIRNNEIKRAYHLHNHDFKNNWSKYIQFPDHMKPYDFMTKRSKNLKTYRENLLPEDKWVANGCITKIEGSDEDGNPISYVKEFYEMILHTIKTFKNVPDCDLLINRKDFQYLHSNPNKYAYTHLYPENVEIPKSMKPEKYWVVCSQNTTDENKDVAVPSADEWNDIHKIKGLKNIYEWKDKKDCVIFRGSSTGCGLDEKTNPRIRLAEISYLLKNPNINIRLNKFVKKIRVNNLIYSYIQTEKFKHLLGEFVTPEEQMKCKYTLNIEGNAAAYRYGGLFGYNSVVIQAESKYKVWFEPLLKENSDYILLKKEIYMNEKDSIEQSKEKVNTFFEKLFSKNKDMKKISSNGNKFFKKYLQDDSIASYFYSLMKKINHLYDTSNQKK